MLFTPHLSVDGHKAVISSFKCAPIGQRGRGQGGVCHPVLVMLPPGGLAASCHLYLPAGGISRFIYTQVHVVPTTGHQRANQLSVQLGRSLNAPLSSYACCLCALQVWLRLAHLQGLRRVPGRHAVHTVYAGHRHRRLPASAPHRRQRRELPGVELSAGPPPQESGHAGVQRVPPPPAGTPAWTSGLWSTK